MAGRVLAVAGLVVIGLLVGLWMLMRDPGEQPALTSAPRDAATTTARAAAQDAAPPSPSARTAPRVPIVMHRPTPVEVAPSVGSARTPAVPEDAAAKPATFEDALKEQVLLTESQVLECNDKALKAGKKLEGEAAFGFTVARKDGKIVIESTGVEYTNFDQPTSDCFRETAHAMTFDALPEGVDAITGYRKVVFSDGALKRQWMTQMNVVRPPPSPQTRP